MPHRHLKVFPGTAYARLDSPIRSIHRFVTVTHTAHQTRHARDDTKSQQETTKNK